MSNKATRDNFYKTLRLYIDKPHIVNKRVCGYEPKWIGISSYLHNLNTLLKELKYLHDQEPSTGHLNLHSEVDSLIQNGFLPVDFSMKNSNVVPWEILPSFSANVQIVIVRNIITKNIENQHAVEIIIIDYSCDNITFTSTNSKKSPPVWVSDYSVTLKEETIEIRSLIAKDAKCQEWCDEYTLPLLLKWASKMDSVPCIDSVSSLSLIDIQHYNKTYQDLKKKYSSHLIQIWTEVTDPLKYIYEDIAIASYLIVLWEREKQDKGLITKQSFLDMGCGNGLLVYILSSEGYPGLGIDIRRRKLWDQFPSHVCLKEDVILPSDKHLYPDYDWLIGNHSDELTPWIPVIAAKSSMNCRFFVIPCCAFDFKSKFQRKKGGMSQYAEYLDYVEEIGSNCGFKMLRDRLRIPSTKRICLIGKSRTYSSERWPGIKSNIDVLIKSKAQLMNDSINNDHQENESKKLKYNESWCEDFKARDPVQKTRNCTHMNTEVRDKLINDIAHSLLSQNKLVKIEKPDYIIEWNRGGKISMKDLIQSLDPAHLKHLKNECGGVQTLLRNHKFVFLCTNGEIQLRIPESVKERHVSPELLRTKRCWFHDHHPQGCTLQSSDCTYLH